MKKFLLIAVISLFAVYSLKSQDTIKKSDPHKGWKFGGALPAIAYDSDLGFRYGILGYIYDWGDGSLYPDYKKSIYFEWSRTTKGSGINTIQYDDRQFLGSKVRLTSQVGYYIEQALDFYGFNGYQGIFNTDYSTQGTADYKSRMFYRCQRNTLRGIFDFQFPINDKLKLIAGFSFFNVKMSSVDIDKLNKGKAPADMLPSTDSVPGIFELYQKWGLISPEEAKGGFVPLLKGGVIFDTRNNEALPTKGLWDEAFVTFAPGMQSREPYYSIFVAHRQYFNIIEKHLSLGYRLVYMGKIAGQEPYFMLPIYLSSKEVQDAIGGSKTVRGILRDRVQANGVAFGNIELRYRIINTKIFHQDFYVALSGFLDATRIIVPYNVDLNKVPLADRNIYFDQIESDIYKFHFGYGGGLRLALNENFIVAVDYGLAKDSRDGSSGLYIGLGWLF